MTKEDKELLLKDLYGRLPYNVEMHIKGEYKTPRTIYTVHVEDKTIGYFKGLDYNEELIENVKPYLRPMSSMTSEECTQLNVLLPRYFIVTPEHLSCLEHINGGIINFEVLDTIIDFYNSHYLDWRRLIPKGLALEATKDMYKF